MHALARNSYYLVNLPWMVMGAVYVAGILVTRRTARRQSSASRWLQTGLTVFAYALLFSGHARFGILGWRIVPRTDGYSVLGLLLAFAGCAIAIWARVALGRNWSATVTVKQDHTLTLRGPYAFVRHPIYSGLILAALGTAMVFSYLGGFLGFALLFATFWAKSRDEEVFMQQEFGEQYTEYRQRVRALIPGVL